MEKNISWLEDNSADKNWDEVFSHFYHKGREEIYPNELKFWQRLCSGKENVLEIGAGNGFIAQALAGAGIKNLTLVEPEPSNVKLLNELAAKSAGATRVLVEPVIFQKYSPPAGVLQDVVYMSWDNLVMFRDREARRRVFMQISGILKPGGLFAFHISSRNWNKKVYEKLRVPKVFDMDLDQYGKARIEYRIDLAAENVYKKYIKISLVSGEEKTYILPTEAIGMPELLSHLEEARLKVIEHSSDYSGTPPGDNPDDHVLVLQKNAA